jgi:hypothetical protein
VFGLARASSINNWSAPRSKPQHDKCKRDGEARRRGDAP